MGAEWVLLPLTYGASRLLLKVSHLLLDSPCRRVPAVLVQNEPVRPALAIAFEPDLGMTTF
jgi:hypothetical protein